MTISKTIEAEEIYHNTQRRKRWATRDYASLDKLENALGVMGKLSNWFNDYNETRPIKD